jgi:serpin B
VQGEEELAILSEQLHKTRDQIGGNRFQVGNRLIGGELHRNPTWITKETVMRIMVLVVFISLCFAGVTNMVQAQVAGSEEAALVGGNNEFAVNLYQQLAETEKGDLFFSPYSISNALAMTYAGARGNTAAEMKKTLGFRLPDDRLHPAFGTLIARLHGDVKNRSFQLTVANRLWGQKDYGFLRGFSKIGSDHYGAGLEEVDYIKATEEARKRINDWVEQQTQQKIKDLIAEGILDDMTRLVLTNAIYFKAPWASPFEARNTKPGDFQLAGGKTVQVPMMRQKWRTDYADLGDFTMVKLPYENGQQSMIVLLPKKVEGLPELEKRLSAENLAQWTEKLRDHEVDVKFPKFKVAAEFSLKDVLKNMGMRDAFVFGKADFSGMATREMLYITAVLHKAFVDVNEAGTEAAAATAVVIGTRSLPKEATFHADHTFLFLIRDEASGTILFMGRVADPS